MADDLRPRILKILGQHGALSVRGMSRILPDTISAPTIEKELKTMERRKLVNEEFVGSYGLTDKGRKEYEALTPGARVPPHGGLAEGTGFDTSGVRRVLEPDPDTDPDLHEEWAEADEEQGTIWDDFGGRW